MMEINALAVKKLREQTGAGIMDCKQALMKTKGDMDEALELLREKGLSSASKKGGRVTTEGLVSAYVSSDKRIGVLIEVNCETDFVAKNFAFKQFVNDVAKLIAVRDPAHLDDIFSLNMTNGKTIDSTLKSLINSFGENINIRRFKRFEVSERGAIGSYIHEDYLTEGKIGVMAEFQVQRTHTLSKPEFALFMRLLLMQIAAAQPLYVQVDAIPYDVLESKKTILRSQITKEGKSESIVEKILRGRLQKFYQDTCLFEQDFFKEPEQTVREWLHMMNQKLDREQILVTRFERFEKGETIQ